MAVRRHLTREQRRELVIRLRQQGWSFPKIAEVLGVDEKTVRRDRSISANAEIEHPPVIQRSDGKTYPAQRRTEEEQQELAERAQALRSEGASFPEIEHALAWTWQQPIMTFQLLKIQQLKAHLPSNDPTARPFNCQKVDN